jgi:hypothetical protein
MPSPLFKSPAYNFAMLAYFDKAGRPARHIAATLITLLSVAGLWFIAWSGLCFFLILLLAKISLATYVTGLFLVFVGLIPALAIIIPSVLWAERLTDGAGLFRYVVQIPIVFPLVLAASLALLIIGGLVNWLLIPGFLGYVGLPAVMALPIAGIYWIICKWIEFGLESIRELLSLIIAGLKGGIDLFQFLRSGQVIPKVKSWVKPLTSSPDTPHSTPLPDPEARGR